MRRKLSQALALVIIFLGSCSPQVQPVRESIPSGSIPGLKLSARGSHQSKHGETNTTPQPQLEAPDLSGNIIPVPPTQADQYSGGEAALPTQKHDEWVEATLENMSIEQKVGQLIIAGIPGDSLSESSCSEIQRVHPAGITFQWYNVISPEQLKKFVESLKECNAAASQVPLFFTLAHEGEYVFRYDHTATKFPAALAIAAAGEASYSYEIGYAAGSELLASGLNMVLGPVADILLELDNEVVSQRTFGSQPELAGRYVYNMVAGYRRAGIITVLKHFPGHGGVAEDSHKLLPVDHASIDEIRQLYIPVFQDGLAAGAEVVMLSHVVYPTISGDELPATISPAVINLLRQELYFQGPILSDHLKMKAISGKNFSIAQASLAAVNAGIDLLLLNDPQDAAESYAALLSAARDQTTLAPERLDEAVRRILTLKSSAGLLRPRLQEISVDWQRHQDLAYQVGLRAVTLYRNEENLIPIPPQKRHIQIIGPITEDFAFFYKQIEGELLAAGFQVSQDHFLLGDKRIEAKPEQIETIVSKASSAELILLFTYQAHLLNIHKQDTWQVELGNQILAIGKPVILVALRSPTDLLEFPQSKTYLTTFGTTRGQLDGLIQILVHGRKPTGINPLPQIK